MERFFGGCVEAVVELSSKKVDSHDAEDEPKDQADQEKRWRWMELPPLERSPPPVQIDSVRAWKQTLNCYVYGFELLNVLDGQ